MIEIGMNGVVKNFGFKNVLKGVSLEIMTNDRVAIVGKNGSGKTTLFNIITGNENADKGLVTIRKGATIGFLEQIPKLFGDGETVLDVLMQPFSDLLAAERKMRELEQKMSDENYFDELDAIIDEYSKYQNKFISLDGYNMQEMLDKICSGFKINYLLERPFNVISGGQKTIVKLAATILKKPGILLLDEPTNHLDIETLEWFETFLSKYNGTVVIISHDRYFLDKAVNKTILLDSGECQCFNGNYSFCLKEQERLLLLEFENYKNQQKKIAAMEEAIKRYRDWAERGNNEMLFKKARELEKRLEKMELIDKPVMEKSKLPINFAGERASKKVLIAEDFYLTINNISLFENVNFELYNREKVCLMGNNGTGKTSFIRAVMGDLEATCGFTRIAENAKIGYIPQEIRFSNEKNSVLDEFRNEFACTEGVARGLLSKFYFYGDNVFKRVGVLSGGEKVLLKLAILIQNNINFLILDEPTNHIDIDTKEILEQALLDFTGTIFFVSHDRYFINKICNRIIFIKNKTFQEYSSYSDYKK